MPSHEVVDRFQLVGSTLEGRFRVERVIAEGGFGVVYQGVQVALERPVAIKVLKTPAGFDEEDRARFLSSFAIEAKTIARIAHPNIVQVYDFGVSEMPAGGRAAWMALEWLTGTTLENDLRARRDRGGRSPAESFAILRPILSALAAVHAEGIAHRDIKPANIMLVTASGAAIPKLLDFGIAKVMEPDEEPGTGHTRTRSPHVAFSPGYAAPEQISHGRSGPWTDVHALALVLSELLTDRPPFDDLEMAVLFQQILGEERPTPRRRGVDVGAWEPVLARALAVRSVARFRDAGELLQALAQALPDARHVPIDGDKSVITDPRSSPGNETLAAMSTQVAIVARGSSAPPRPEPRTTTREGGARERAASRPRSPARVAAFGAAVLAAVGAGLWFARPPAQGPTLAPEASSARAAAVGSEPSALLPSPSASSSVAPLPPLDAALASGPSDAPDASAPIARPDRPRPATKPARAPAPSASASSRIVIE